MTTLLQQLFLGNCGLGLSLPLHSIFAVMRNLHMFLEILMFRR